MKLVKCLVIGALLILSFVSMQRVSYAQSGSCPGFSVSVIPGIGYTSQASGSSLVGVTALQVSTLPYYVPQNPCPYRQIVADGARPGGSYSLYFQQILNLSAPLATYAIGGGMNYTMPSVTSAPATLVFTSTADVNGHVEFFPPAYGVAGFLVASVQSNQYALAGPFYEVSTGIFDY